MNHNYQINQEIQAKCPHGKEWLGFEMSLGKWRTGDRVCRRCRGTFPPDEEILPVEYRSQMIITPHALLVAVKLNDDLEMRYNSDPGTNKFVWALFSKSTGKVKMGVARDVAEECVARGLIEKVEVEQPKALPRGRRRKQWNFNDEG